MLNTKKCIVLYSVDFCFPAVCRITGNISGLIHAMMQRRTLAFFRRMVAILT